MAHKDYVLDGNNLMIFITSGSTTYPCAFSTSAKLSVSANSISKASKDDGIWTSSFAGKRDWSITTDGLYNLSTTGATYNIQDLYNMYLAGQAVVVSFAQITGTSPEWELDNSVLYFTGSAFVEKIDINADMDNAASYSISLKGTGPLTLT